MFTSGIWDPESLTSFVILQNNFKLYIEICDKHTSVYVVNAHTVPIPIYLLF